MNAGQEEIVFLPRPTFDARNHAGTVAVADFVRDYPNGQSATLAQRPRKKVGAVIELSRCRENPLTGVLGNVLSRRRIVQDSRDRPGGQSHVGRNRLERNHVPIGTYSLLVVAHALPGGWVAALQAIFRRGCLIIYKVSSSNDGESDYLFGVCWRFPRSEWLVGWRSVTVLHE